MESSSQNTVGRGKFCEVVIWREIMLRFLTRRKKNKDKQLLFTSCKFQYDVAAQILRNCV